MNSNNNWLSENGKQQIDFYISGKNEFLIERNRTNKILFDLYKYHFEEIKELKILDLGCGDGSMIKKFASLYPDNEYYLMDGSSDMLSMAKKNLPGKGFIFIESDFDQYINRVDELYKYHMIFSSNAIHHLDFTGKSKIYSKIYRELIINGLFINIDVVLPPTDQCEAWEFKMWIDWINENMELKDQKEDIGKYDDLPLTYKAKPENQPSRLNDQLDLLCKIGFKNVDCFYKYGIFSMFGGTK